MIIRDGAKVRGESRLYKNAELEKFAGISSARRRLLALRRTVRAARVGTVENYSKEKGRSDVLRGLGQKRTSFLPGRILCAAFRGSRRVGGESGLDRSARSGLSGRDMSFYSPPRRSMIETLAA